MHASVCRYIPMLIKRNTDPRYLSRVRSRRFARRRDIRLAISVADAGCGGLRICEICICESEQSSSIRGRSPAISADATISSANGRSLALIKTAATRTQRTRGCRRRDSLASRERIRARDTQYTHTVVACMPPSLPRLVSSFARVRLMLTMLRARRECSSLPGRPTSRRNRDINLD